MIDISRINKAIHQNHDYSHHKDGKDGVWFGEESKYNKLLLGNWRQLYTIQNSTHFLDEKGIHYNRKRYFQENLRVFRLEIRDIINKIFKITRPIRRKIKSKINLQKNKNL